MTERKWTKFKDRWPTLKEAKNGVFVYNFNHVFIMRGSQLLDAYFEEANRETKRFEESLWSEIELPPVPKALHRCEVNGSVCSEAQSPEGDRWLVLNLKHSPTHYSWSSHINFCPFCGYKAGDE